MKENYPDFVWASDNREVDFDPEAQSYIVQPHARDKVNIIGKNAVSNIFGVFFWNRVLCYIQWYVL